MELSAISVLPSYWRRGIGRRLLRQILTIAEERGLGESVLWVLESNHRARQFYESEGFAPDGTTRVFTERRGASAHELRYRRQARES